MRDVDIRAAKMHARTEAQVKVAVYEAQVPTPETQRRFFQEALAVALIALSATAMLGLS